MRRGLLRCARNDGVGPRHREAGGRGDPGADGKAGLPRFARNDGVGPRHREAGGRGDPGGGGKAGLLRCARNDGVGPRRREAGGRGDPGAGGKAGLLRCARNDGVGPRRREAGGRGDPGAGKAREDSFFRSCQVVGVGLLQALLEVDGGLPAEVFQAGAVHQFAHCAVGLGGVELDGALVANHFGDGLGGFADGQVAAVADVDVAEHGLGVGVVAGFVEVHDKDAGGGHVVDVEEFTVRRAGAPEGDAGFGGNAAVDRIKADHFADVGRDFALALLVGFNAGDVACQSEFGKVELTDHGRQNVAVGEMVVVTGAVEVGRHDAAVVAPVLAVIAFAQFDAGDFGDGVGFVGRFQQTGQ